MPKLRAPLRRWWPAPADSPRARRKVAAATPAAEREALRARSYAGSARLVHRPLRPVRRDRGWARPGRRRDGRYEVRGRDGEDAGVRSCRCCRSGWMLAGHALACSRKGSMW